MRDTPRTPYPARMGADASAVQVLDERHEVMFRDGTAVVLRPVAAHGVPLLTQRALELPHFPGTTQLQLFDLARLVPRLDADLRGAPRRDATGLVFYLLRAAFNTAADFRAAANRNALGNWWPFSDGTYQWQPLPRAIDAQVAAAAVAADLTACPRPQAAA